MSRCLGIDIHKRELRICIPGPAGPRDVRVPATRDAVLAFAKHELRPDDRIALEATCNTWPLVELLRPFVAQVVVSNPLRTKAIAQSKIKTDKVDARVLGDLLRADYLPPVWQPDPQTQALRRLSSERASLVAQRTGIKNRIHAVLHQRLLPAPTAQLFGRTGRRWLDNLQLDPEGRLSLDRELRLLDATELEIAQLEAGIARRGYTDDRVKLLLTLPGVDLICAQTLLAALGDISRFPSGDFAAAYLGLAPRTKQSGDHCYHGPITKQGNAHARWVLVQAAQHLATHPGPLGAFFRRLARRKHRNVAVVATARKLVVIAWLMLKHHEPYRYGLPRSTEAKLSRLRIRAGGARRQGGSPKGHKSLPKLAPGVPARTIKPLAQVYAEAGLPPNPPLARGELRTLRRTHALRFVSSLQRTHLIPKKQSTSPIPSRTA